MARGTNSSVITALSVNPTKRTRQALHIARTCYNERSYQPHPDPVLVCFVMTIPDTEGYMAEYEAGSSQAYSRFVEFCCDVWQLLIFGLID